MKHLIIIISSTIFLPVFAAQPLVTCTDGPNCGWNELMTMANNIFGFAIWLVLPLAAIGFIYAGFLLLKAGYQGDKEGLKKVREMFTKFAIGILLVISAFLIIRLVINILGVDGGIVEMIFGALR